jgi:hypothetical protein
LPRVVGDGPLQGSSGLIVGGNQVIEALPQVPIVVAFPILERGAVGRVGQVEGGVEQSFHLTRVERHRQACQGWFPRYALSRAKQSQQREKIVEPEILKGAFDRQTTTMDCGRETSSGLAVKVATPR